MGGSIRNTNLRYVMRRRPATITYIVANAAAFVFCHYALCGPRCCASPATAVVSCIGTYVSCDVILHVVTYLCRLSNYALCVRVSPSRLPTYLSIDSLFRMDGMIRPMVHYRSDKTTMDLRSEPRPPQRRRDVGAGRLYGHPCARLLRQHRLSITPGYVCT